MTVGECCAHSKRSATLRLGPLMRSTAEEFGSALRRTLMRVPGLAVRAVKMEAAHEFSLLPGVVEDTVEIVENLKVVRFRGGDGPHYVTIDVKGPAMVTGLDLAGSELQVVNPGQPIATVNQGGHLEMKVQVALSLAGEAGRSPNFRGFVEVGAVSHPVDRVQLQVEERDQGAFLSLGVATNGTIEPHEAIDRAATLLASVATGEKIRTLCRQVLNAKARSEPATEVPPPVPSTRDMGKMPPRIELPDLTDLCRRSFESFAQLRVAPSRRRNAGLQRLLKEAFAQQAAAEFVGYALGKPDTEPSECVKYGTSYQAQLTVRFKRKGATAAEEAVVGHLPLMTVRGTFVVSGIEKAVMGELVDACENRTTRENDLTERRAKLVGEQLADALAGAFDGAIETDNEFRFPYVAETVSRFFASNPLVQRAETTNPLALLTQLRRVVQTDVGRQRGHLPRQIHRSHWGRLCTIDTPEGERIGLNLTVAVLAGVDDDGFLTTPYRRRTDGELTYLNAAEQTEATVTDGCCSDAALVARYGGKILALQAGEIVRADEGDAEYLTTHSAHSLSPSAGLIPFLANDDSNRALMGNNMQKQAVPLLHPQAPMVRTGMEGRIAEDARAAVLAAADGVVERVSAREIVVCGDGEYSVGLEGFIPSPLSTCQRQRPLVRQGDKITAGQVLADGPATDQGVLALGRNLLVGFLPWDGFNFEDAVVVSQRLVDEEAFTSIKVKEYIDVIRKTDADRVSIGIAHLPPDAGDNLSPSGIVREGASIAGGDILVAKSTSGSKVIDRSLRLPVGHGGTVIEVDHFRADRGDPLAVDVEQLIKVRVAVRRPLTVGDKLASRHGAKGVVGLVIPEDEMPVLPDGKALEMLVSPLGLPSRMNFGQVLEAHAGFAANALNCTIESPGFNGALTEEVSGLLEEAGLPPSGMLPLRDGRTGQLFERETTVGYIYYMKLDHMAEDLIKTRSAGPMTAREPLEKPQGYRLGIMETWALQAHGAAHMLREMSTVQGDSEQGLAYDALVQGAEFPPPRPTRSIARLSRQLRGLCLDLQLLDADGHRIGLKDTLEGVDLDVVDMASVAFATPQALEEWGPVAELPDATAVEAFLQSDARDSVGLIPLACPVQHPWRTILAANASLPEIARLPVLARSLRNGRAHDSLYLALAAVNDIVRSDDTANLEVRSALQEAVDELIGDGIGGDGLSRLLYGKRGWFASAMTGNRVDYSGKAVVAPGPNLRQDECGLPRRMARALFSPFVVGALLRTGKAGSEEEARRMIRDRDNCAERELDQVASTRLVLLHRAPVLHRWGIQAFKPVLTEEEVLRLHPLTNVTFNADFDGDALEVFLPLSTSAQREAQEMRPTANQLGSADGTYIHGLSQEMVLGCYYATGAAAKEKPVVEIATTDAVAAAFDRGDVFIHDPVRVTDRSSGIATVGRVLFGQLLPDGLDWTEGQVDKWALEDLLDRCWHQLGSASAAELANAMMGFGFRMATRSGVSLGKDTLSQFSEYDEMLSAAWQRADEIAATGNDEQESVNHWMEVHDRMTVRALEEHAVREGGFNATHMMAVSGARGNSNQLRHQIAMRGLSVRQDGSPYSLPCTTTNVRGQSPLEFLAGVEGARRGLADCTLKAAHSGYLFKRIVNAVQDVLITEDDCSTDASLEKRPLHGRRGEVQSLEKRIAGRFAAADILLAGSKVPIVEAGNLIGRDEAAEIGRSAVESVLVRSPITCESSTGVCSKCYGVELSRWSPATVHLPVGIIAAQSLGEPLTQLTLRSFTVSMPGQTPSANIIASLPGLEDLFEAGRRPGKEESELRAALLEMLEKDGVAGVGSYLLDSVLQHYRDMGVPLDDRHLEIVISRMVRSDGIDTGPTIRGVTEVARQGTDFMTAAVSFNGVTTLARAAASNQRMHLNGVSSSTAFGKLMPARV